MATVYILKDNLDQVYVGSTTNITRRLQEHGRGHTASTKRLKELKVIWQKELPTLALARIAEKKIKKWKSRKMIELLIQGVFDI